jgi:hypothetical protein
MGRKHTGILLLTALSALSLALAAGCGGDDTVGANPDGGPGTDGGSDVSVPPPPPPGDGGPNPDGGPKPDASDGGACDFNAFVTGLITSHTNGTDQPSADLGESCVDTHTPFPQTLF